MASYNPPIENLTIFDSSLFLTSISDSQGPTGPTGASGGGGGTTGATGPTGLQGIQGNTGSTGFSLNIEVTTTGDPLPLNGTYIGTIYVFRYGNQVLNNFQINNYITLYDKTIGSTFYFQGNITNLEYAGGFGWNIYIYLSSYGGVYVNPDSLIFQMYLLGQAFTGPTGIQGNIGPTGLQGIQGNTGPTGIQGNIGPTGLIGLQGNIGPTGLQGIQGNTGPTGIQGNIGNTGPTGIGIISSYISNNNLYFNYSNSGFNYYNNILGDDLSLATPTTTNIEFLISSYPDIINYAVVGTLIENSDNLLIGTTNIISSYQDGNTFYVEVLRSWTNQLISLSINFLQPTNHTLIGKVVGPTGNTGPFGTGPTGPTYTLQSDPTPTLGGNLNTNNHLIVGGPYDSGNILVNGSITLTSDRNYGGVIVKTTDQLGGLGPYNFWYFKPDGSTTIPNLIQSTNDTDFNFGVYISNINSNALWKISGNDSPGVLIAPPQIAGYGFAIDVQNQIELGYGTGDYSIYQFSGEMIITDLTAGYMYKFLLGGSLIQLLGTTNPYNWSAQTAPSTNKTITGWISMTVVSGTGYKFTNLASTRNYNISGIKSRNHI